MMNDSGVIVESPVGFNGSSEPPGPPNATLLNSIRNISNLIFTLVFQYI